METFKPIKDIEWLKDCEVSNYGRIRKPNKQFYPRYYNNNTAIVCEHESEEAWTGARGKTASIAKIMLKAFYDNYDPDKHKIIYFNGAAHDIRLENITYKEKMDVTYNLNKPKEIVEFDNSYIDKDGTKVVVYEDKNRYLKEWVENLKEKEISRSTIQTYLWRIEEYYKYTGQVTKKNIIEHKDILLRQNKSPKTINLFISAMKNYLNFLAEYLHMPDLLLIVNGLKTIKVQHTSHLDNVISEKEVTLLLEYTKNKKMYKYYYIILTLANTGARVSELITFKAKGVFDGYFEVIGKGCKYRKILIPDMLKKELIEWIQINQYTREDYLFTSDLYKKPISTRGIAHQLKDIATAAKLKNIDVVYPHSFRHYFAKKLLKETKDISFVSNMLGHSSVAVTSIYTKLSLKEQQKLLEKVMK